jgi:ADP-ribose pyrophosphatase YjhB (NUDIX family)
MLRHARFFYCPSCGKRPVEGLLHNAMRCPSCGFVYFHNCASCVAAIITVKQGIVLTVRNRAPKRGLLDLPGGFCNYGESLEDALVREVREELNLELSDLAYFGSFPNVYRYKNVTYFTTDAIFLCTAQNLPAAAPNDEIAGIRVVRPALIDLSRIGFSSTRAALARYSTGRRR